MGNNDGFSTKQENGARRKTPEQLEALENHYSEEHYPTQKAMEDYARVLKLTYKQVRGWFVERRRKGKREKRLLPSKNVVKGNAKCGMGKGFFSKALKRGSLSRKLKTQLPSKYSRLELPELLGRGCTRLRLNNQQVGYEDKRASARKLKNTKTGGKNNKQKRKLVSIQDMLPSDYILKKIFRKDGPPLGVEFDSLPPGALEIFTDPKSSHSTHAVNQRASKRRKVSKLSNLDSEACKKKSSSVMKHGMGKGLMTVWRATNPKSGNVPTSVREDETLSNFLEPLRLRKKKSLHQKLAEKQRRLGNKLVDARKRINKKTKIGNKGAMPKKANQEECKLAIKGPQSQYYSNGLSTLVDDEELELRELKSGPNALTCCANLASNGLHSCSLCKDLLARFPPNSVKMKQPLHMQPWDSSPELVKKLFKVFRFLYTHSVAIHMCPFTLDEFAQAFHDKDSMLLGNIHVALLKLLLSDVEGELSRGSFSRASKDWRYLAFLHSVKHQELVVKFWNRSLNPLTWTEILRQVVIAAGFGSKQMILRRELNNKEGNHMVKYGLYPGTLKGELFSILSEQGSCGLKISELANASQIVDLNLVDSIDELEHQICSTLSSDITLFEKISPSAYRLRNNPFITKGVGDFDSESEDSGSVDDSGGSITNSSSDESDVDSASTSLSMAKYKGHRKKKDNMSIEDNEIDESHSGEVWVLGLMEGEYSDLSIEEKLYALVALSDLTSAGLSLQMEDPMIITEGAPTSHQGGGKIKRSSTLQNLPKPLPVDSSVTISKNCRKEYGSKAKGTGPLEDFWFDGHPLQSIYLGSDRRYNSYWLFLGPCNAKDPGHRRVYFESSEDGHWEVIDTEEALCALLSVLDSRGMREARLFSSLEKREVFLCQSMSTRMSNDNDIMQTQSDQSGLELLSGDGSSPISDIDNLNPTETRSDSLASSGAIILQNGKKREEQIQKWDRLQAFDAWIWSSFYSNLNAVKHGKRSYLDSLARCESCHDLYWRDEKHCKICHCTFELDFDLEEKYAIHAATCRERENNIFPKHKLLSSQLQSLKAAIHAIEAVMPQGALLSAWKISTHKLWVKRLRRTTSVPEFLQVLTDFIGAIDEDWLCQCNFELGSNSVLEEILVHFPNMPQTTSAIALWLVKLDSLIAPYLDNIQSEKPQRSTGSTRSTRSTSEKGRSAPS